MSKAIELAKEVTTLHLRVLKLESQIRTLERGDKVVQDPQAQAEKLKNALAALKLRNSRGQYQTGDDCRKEALQVELGKILLQLDGVL